MLEFSHRVVAFPMTGVKRLSFRGSNSTSCTCAQIVSLLETTNPTKHTLR